jgi:hypothetical protein
MAPSVSHALRAAERVQRVVFVSCNPHGTVLRAGAHRPGWQPLNPSCPASNRRAIGTRTARPFAHCPVRFAHGPSSFTLAVMVDARSDYAYFADYVVRGGSLASHARILCESRGKGAPFRLVAAAPVDMFAHTPHCELVLTFERCEQRCIPRAPQSQGAARRSGAATAVKGPVP